MGSTVGQTFLAVGVGQTFFIWQQSNDFPFMIFHFSFSIENKCGGLLTCPRRNGEVNCKVGYSPWVAISMRNEK